MENTAFLIYLTQQIRSNDMMFEAWSLDNSKCLELTLNKLNNLEECSFLRKYQISLIKAVCISSLEELSHK